MSSIIPNTLNYVREPIYDTYQAAATTALPVKITFFDQPVSSTKGRELTNVPAAYKLYDNELFQITSLRFVFINTGEADIESFYKSYVAVLKLQGKEQVVAPMEYFPGGMGIYNGSQVANGPVDPRSVTLFGSDPEFGDLSMRINPGETFSLELQATTAFTTAAAVFLRAYLDGIKGKTLG